MKRFDYSARDSKGAICRGSLEAVDRASAMADLKRQGLVPISIVDGKRMAPSSVHIRVSPRILLCAVLLVSLIGLFFFRAKTFARSTSRPAQKAIVKRAAPRDVTHSRKPVANGIEKVAIEVPKVSVSATGAHAMTEVAVTVVHGSATNAIRRRPGVHVLDKNGQEVFKQRPELKTNTDKFLWAVVNAKGTSMIPVSTLHVVRDFEKALNEPIKIMSDDSPEDIANKKKIEQVKKEIQAMLKQGYQLPDVIRAIQQDRNVATDLRREVQKNLLSLIREGKIEQAVEFQKAANVELSAEQIEPIYAPSKLVEMGVDKAEVNKRQ